MPLKKSNDRLRLLAKKWLSGNITEKEKAEFDKWYNDFDDTELITRSAESVDEVRERLYKTILENENIGTPVVRRLFPWKRLAVAASVLLVMATGIILFTKRKMPVQQSVAHYDIHPGGNKAILVLSNGKQIILTDAKKGRLAVQNNAEIQKTDSGAILYSANSKTHDAAASTTEYNTIITPKGGQYLVKLSDGTTVLLNAASSLRYPTTFTGSKRLVELKGEAYFEVAKDKTHPFIVSAANQRVEVLGTHFNINSYDDEPAIKTTLLEGSVKVSDPNSGKAGILKPGEQSVIANNQLEISKVNTEEAVAWKNGYFKFDDEDIESIMRKVSRWYDVDIIYDGPHPVEHFGGTVNRFASVSKLLSKLELTENVHFKIEGRRVIVSK